jgi:hypothetical protein
MKSREKRTRYRKLRQHSGRAASSKLAFSAIFLQSLAMRPVHEYNVSMGGDAPQVPVLSKLAMSDQRHNGITLWHTSQVEGLVRVNLVQVQVLSPAVQAGQGVRRIRNPCLAVQKTSLLHPLDWCCPSIASGDANGFPPEKRRIVLLPVLLARQAAQLHRRRC